MPDERYIETDLHGDDTLREHRQRLDAEADRRATEHRRFFSRRDREDDYTPLCATPECPHFATHGSFCSIHRAA